MITPTTCILALAVTLQTAQPKLNADTRNWIAENLCAAAEDRGVDVRLLGAYLLNENNAIDLYSIRPARCGKSISTALILALGLSPITERATAKGSAATAKRSKSSSLATRSNAEM